MENARQAQHAQEKAKTARAEQSTARQKKQAVAQEEAAHLDALWEELDAATREQVQRQARHRLGVLGQAGRAPAALVAMRRNLMREQGLDKPVAEGDEPKDQ